MTQHPPALATEICAVIVTHQPDEAFFTHVPAIAQMVGQVVVVDNGSHQAIKERLVGLASQGILTLFHSPKNNLAMAQNMGIAYAKSAGARFVLLLDDDSTPSADMIDALLAIYVTQSADRRIGLIAPHMVDTHSQRVTHYAQANGWLFRRLKARDTDLIWDAFNIIASGSLIPLEVLKEVGGMDESYVIDYIDKEFCLRLLKAGYHTLVVPRAILHHSIGHCQDHQLLGQRITTTNHSPLRRYYIFRNRLRTCVRYTLSCPAFVMHDLLAMGYDVLRIGLYEKQKTKKFIYMLAGIWDACLGKSGPKPRWENHYH